jgi:hypothetical protein
MTAFGLASYLRRPLRLNLANYSKIKMSKEISQENPLEYLEFLTDYNKINTIRNLPSRVERKIIEVIKEKSISKKYVISEHNFMDYANPNTLPVYIEGFFESETYWLDKNIINHIQSKINARGSQIQSLRYNAFIAVHVRLGDLILQNRVVIPGERYYMTAISEARTRVGNLEALVFTDDIIEFTIRYPNLIKMPGVSISPPSSSLNHLSLMSVAESIVCSNSTFSWWGSRLARKSIPVFIPSRYLKNPDPNSSRKYDFWPDSYTEVQIKD